VFIDNHRIWIKEKLINASIKFYNTPEGDNLLYNQDIVYLVEVKSKQNRLKLSIPANENDREFTKVVFSTTLDTCKMFEGVRSNPVMKVFMENFNSKGFGCPFKPDQSYKITNLSCSDNFLPPFPVEVKFILESNFYGLIAGKKGWQPLYGVKYSGRYKK
jgi:Protein of unknown function (DUF1091)